MAALCYISYVATAVLAETPSSDELRRHISCACGTQSSDAPRTSVACGIHGSEHASPTVGRAIVQTAYFLLRTSYQDSLQQRGEIIGLSKMNLELAHKL
jgi:hypothetical protein